MLFALSLLIPLLLATIWFFFRLAPATTRPRAQRLFNAGALLTAAALGVAECFYVQGTMAGSPDHALWPAIATFYVCATLPIWLGVAAVLRRLIFGLRGQGQPLDFTQGSNQIRF